MTARHSASCIVVTYRGAILKGGGAIDGCRRLSADHGQFLRNSGSADSRDHSACRPTASISMSRAMGAMVVWKRLR
jgi:hypothetical protein